MFRYRIQLNTHIISTGYSFDASFRNVFINSSVLRGCVHLTKSTHVECWNWKHDLCCLKLCTVPSCHVICVVHSLSWRTEIYIYTKHKTSVIRSQQRVAAFYTLLQHVGPIHVLRIVVVVVVVRSIAMLAALCLPLMTHLHTTSLVRYVRYSAK